MSYTGTEAIAMIKLLSTPIVVPETIRRKAGLRPGDRVEFRVSGGAITISSRPTEAAKGTPLSRALNRGLAQSEREFEAGLASGPFESHEEFVQALRGPVQKKHRQKTSRRR